MFGLTYAWLSLGQAALLHGDSTRDLLLARDLAEGNVLHEQGAPAAFGKFVHGSAGIDLFALGLRFELGIVGLERLVRALLAGGVALTVLGLARVLDRRVDDPGLLAGAAVFVALLPGWLELPTFWQPTLLPVPALLVHLALWRTLVEGETIDALATGLFLAWAIDVHLAAAAFGPCALASILASARRPLLAASCFVLACVGLLALDSWAFVLTNLGELEVRGGVVPAALVVVAAIVLGLLARARVRGLSLARRLGSALALELGMLALAWLLAHAPGLPPLSPRHVLVFAPASILVFALLPLGRGGAAAIAGLALMLAAPGLRATDPELPLRTRWLLCEVERIAEVAAARGYDWPALVEHLQSTMRTPMLAGLAAFERPRAAIDPPPDEDLIVIGLRPREAAEVAARLGPERLLDRFPIDGGEALIVRLPARVRRVGSMLRFEGGADSAWREVSQLPPPAFAHLASARAYTSVWQGDDRPHLDPGATRVIWRLPFVVGPARVVGTFADAARPDCGWTIEALEIEGRVRPIAPTHALRLPAERAGWIEIGRGFTDDFGAKDCVTLQEEGELPPGTIETALEDHALRRALGLAEPGLSQPGLSQSEE
ncbi:hypothetical protein ACNOYE_36860 [Nannocystaceae bacterium ST9]